jgi:hypothetical protein
VVIDLQGQEKNVDPATPVKPEKEFGESCMVPL